ncbi:hypothetical protein Cgig2_005521 [Carnegiea gigantea]|uniref:Uncharacterized protein n=1 Tax=Carnegiea gigantea TaxID=171969 RepID=A0A9Q1JSD9_9CARY|nr:hypothetical protein Cgig2_005521 [Carnegiea gigantea]
MSFHCKFCSIIIMFRSRVTLEEYLKSVQYEDAAGEDVSLDDIDMTPDLEEEEIETVGENIFESRVSIDMNPSLITTPDDFKDDKEGKFLLPDEVQVNQKILKSVGERDVAVDIVKRKTGASEVVFSEATVPAETFAYHKLTGPESSGRGDNAEENQRTNTPLASEHIRNTLETMPTLAKNNEVPVKDACQIENPIVVRDKGGAAHTSRSPQVQNQPNLLEGINKSSTTQISKKHIGATNGMENSTIGMPQPCNHVNQVDAQNTSMGENTNTSSCSKQLNIARRLNFDQREQVRC